MATEEGRHDVHSIYSASSSHRWSRPDGCPASAVLASMAPRGASSPAAEEGTKAHRLLESLLRHGCAPADEHFPETMWESVEMAVEYVEKLKGPGTRVWVEEKLSWPVVDWLPAEHGVYGFGDVVLWTPHTTGRLSSRRVHGRLDVIDYKNGVGPVPPKENRQGLQYMISAMHTLSFFAYSLDAHFHIIQPNSFNPRPQEEWSWEITPEALDQYTREVEAAIEANAIWHLTGSMEHLTYRPSAENCHWCAGFATCPAARAAAEDVPPIKAAKEATPEELARMLAKAGFLEAWAKEVRAIGYNAAMAGVAIPDWKLVEVERHRKFTKPIDTVLEYVADYGVHLDDAAPRVLLTPPQMDKLVRAKLKEQGFKPKDITLASERVALLSDRPPADSYSLVPASHKKPAVDPRRANHFEGLQAAPETTVN